MKKNLSKRVMWSKELIVKINESIIEGQEKEIRELKMPLQEERLKEQDEEIKKLRAIKQA